MVYIHLIDAINVCNSTQLSVSNTDVPLKKTLNTFHALREVQQHHLDTINTGCTKSSKPSETPGEPMILILINNVRRLHENNTHTVQELCDRNVRRSLFHSQ